MQRPAFTLVEALLVIAILAVVTAISIPLYNEYQIRSDLNLATEQATQGLARAKILSESGKNDSTWGFFVPNGTLYKGKSYEARDASFDEMYPMPSTIKTTGLLEVNFSRMEGVPSATGSITLTSLTGDQQTILLTIDKSGVAMNQSDTITVCHKPSGSTPHSITISDNAWPAHQAHGDSLGVCPVTGSSAASSVSSVSSAVASSVASHASSAGGGGTGSASSAGTCANRFSVSADGTITTTSTVNVTFKVIGSQITYGAGGPDINVYVSYSKDGGKKFSSLFNGADVDGGETQTVSGIASGSKMITGIQGYFKKNGWLTFDQTFLSNDQTGHVLTLRNGDSLPDYPAFNGQQSLKTFLQPYVNAQKKIVVGPYDVLYLVELGAIGSPMPSTADFQDAVLIESFAQIAGACN